MVVLAALMFAGWGGPATLLLFTFITGCCTAMMSPAWNSAVGEILPRDELPQAITAMSIAYNGARALGPALAGLVFGLASSLGGAGVGGGAVFVLSLGGIVVLALDFHRRPPRPHPPTRLPPERLWGGTLAGLRYAWHAETILAQLVRTAAYSAAGSALWALLPVIGQQRLGLGAAGFGGLMACLGAGAVAAGLTIGPLRQRLGLERLVAVCCVLFCGGDGGGGAVALGPAGLPGPGGRRRRLDGGDEHLQHRHPDQRAALGAQPRHCHACAQSRWGRLRWARPCGARWPACWACRRRCCWPRR